MELKPGMRVRVKDGTRIGEFLGGCQGTIRKIGIRYVYVELSPPAVCFAPEELEVIPPEDKDN